MRGLHPPFLGLARTADAKRPSRMTDDPQVTRWASTFGRFIAPLVPGLRTSRLSQALAGFLGFAPPVGLRVLPFERGPHGDAAS